MPDEIDLAQEREHIATNPFKTSVGYLVTADDRAHAARTFDLEECRRALKMPDLQKTVRTAIERRMRKLEKEVSEQKIAPAR